MGDIVDRAQQQEQDDRERLLHAILHRQVTPSRLTCEECEVALPEARRIAVPGVRLCVNCQAIAELKSKHYRAL
ncbi:TraR/DksA family transcriptional regulator [Erwinia sp. 9145]|uniref:TraR/DksA family transcriptional regulator n=1 Tax=Erwinia sp. 9145 TaxID=1500895 RepID=UPI000553E156|nr:TraR/DksA family transcriptional regulator [Erwinia sp. 9145]